MPNKLTEAEIQKLIPLVEQTRWHYRLDKFTDDSLGLINKSVNQARREVASKLATINPKSEFTKQRLEALGQELQDTTVAIQYKITGQIENVVTEVATKSYAKHADILSFGGLVPNFNNVQLTAVQLKSIVDTPLGGKLLGEWVSTTFTANLKEKYKTDIATGMLKGESYKNLVKRFKTDAFEGLERDMEGLTRTYVQTINTNAMKDTMMANADIMKGWKWNSVYENRTCIRCMSMDAKDEIYPIDGGPQIPLHVNCRCFPEPITKTFRELGVDIDEMKDSYRPYTIRGKIDPVTGRIIPGKIGVGGGRIIDTGRFLGNYDDFFKQLPENVQMQMLGPTRFGMYKAGKLPLSGLTDASGNTKLLTELGVVQKGVKQPYVWDKIKTDDEAFESLEKFGLGSVSGLFPKENIKITNLVGKDIAGVFNSKPGLAERMVKDKPRISLTVVNEPGLGINSDSVGLFYGKWNKIKISSHLKSGSASSMGGWSVGGTTEVVYRHELGHAIQDVVFNAEERKQWRDIYFKNKSTISDISKYAATNNSEAFAESFAHWSSPKYKGDLPKPIHNFFEEIFKK